MTVIAYKNGRMACDSLCADSETGSIWFKGTKIIRTKAGALVGSSGCADDRAIMALLKSTKTGATMPTAKDCTETKCEGTWLLALPDGEVWSIQVHHNKEWEADVCRITGMGGMGVAGCGGDMAMAFMRAGKTAREACALTCEINCFCRPPIYEEVLHPAKAEKPAAPRRGPPRRSPRQR